MGIIVGIVMKPFLTSQVTGSLWKDLYVKQDFTDILSTYNITTIGIIPQGISLDRENSDDISLSKEKELTDIEKNRLISQMNLCDGLILQGGLSSHKYEVFIAQYAIEHDIPILGICAGFNNIARAVNTEVSYDEELAKNHDIYSPEHCHSIIIQNNAKVLLLKDVSNREIFVNSIHSMTLRTSTSFINNRIVVEAIAKDPGICGMQNVTVEAFSVKDTRFCLAIKWHPELLPYDEITEIIFRKFVEACKMYN